MSNIRKPYAQTVAAVRSGVVASLIQALISLDSELKNSLPAGQYAMKLKAPEGIENLISFNGGTRGAVLKFVSCEAMSDTLSGSRGAFIPYPTGGGFSKALKAFQSCAGAVSKAMSFVPEKDDKEGIEKKTRLLLTAALRGVSEIYNYDHWVKVKSAAIPAGTIAVLIVENPEISGTITIENKKMTFTPGADLKTANAVLEFASIDTCYGVLTGQVAAMAELGSGKVMLKGRLPMIQGLFPLLDRFGELMK
ncbi:MULTISPECIES: hypothetical protein [unclassified Oceanispirochaeta]|uniref:hypothetical protein n=1 Tax=unclassified Oceanispirochaeta TaxID=2635722 RepID=UPI000E09B563|nr:MULTISPECIES: hypothetical protein [unclassified Oceanispirochaeta]MBF9014792.1 hypothetical protein [Oceanispirochaeta sp. M2]NPD71048.1 hypothetical protein [Oceanispirochaeta sp. M1]RDG33881.1 hypothetical protein DV872_02950 [Oceanispirochaeta sp. M1]